ncbi:MAG: OsmC family protein [Alphaproteobacteria bacterium]|nr:OsmC family protein [Alphaproteobacteria bacterium]
MAQHPTKVTVRETGDGRFTQEIKTGSHVLIADEPEDMGGLDSGPAPYDMLLAALGSCTSMTIRMYADQKKWPLESVTVELTHRKETGADNIKRDVITREITLEGPLDDTQRQRLLEIANKCPIHKTLESKPDIQSVLAPVKPQTAAPADKPKPPQKPPQI